MKHLHGRMKLIIARAYFGLFPETLYRFLFYHIIIFFGGLIRLSTQMAVAATGDKEITTAALTGR